MNTLNTAVTKKSAVVEQFVEPAVTPAVAEVRKMDHVFVLKAARDRKALIAEGANSADLDRPESRMFSVDVSKGELVFEKGLRGNIKEVLTEGRILATYSLTGEELGHNVLIVATSERTYFHMLPGSKCYGFYVPAVSLSLQDAVINLLSNNLVRGKEIFEKTSSRLSPYALFLLEMALVAFPEGGVVTLPLAMGSREEPVVVPVKLHLDGALDSAAFLAVGNQTVDFDFLMFPEGFGQLAYRQMKVVRDSKKKVSLSMERLAMIKPKQKTRAEKEEEIRLATQARMLNTPACAPGCLPAPVVVEKTDTPATDKPAKQKPPKKVKKVVEKKPEATKAPKEGKKKK